MTVISFKHFNLRAERCMLDRLRDFYVDVVGLHEGPRPPFRGFGYWLYIGQDDVLHLSESSSGEVRALDVLGTFDHVAFRCSDREAIEAHLDRLGVAFERARVPATGEIQIFLDDPAGNGVELNFAPSSSKP